jgi:type III pantothenate kinase
MSVNLLAISVGNTRTQVGAFVGGVLAEQRRCENSMSGEIGSAVGTLHDLLRDAEASAVYLASVNEEAAERVTGIIEERLGVAVLRVERDVQIPIGRQLDREAIVGEDRLLNAAAAFDRFRQACAIIDAGTAVTVDFVDGVGTFHGGAIFPGLRLQARALHEHTAQLPLIEFDRPDEPIGHNTIQAMRVGLFHGTRGAVRELVEKYAELYAGYPKVIATGGDAEALFDGYDLVEAIIPELTLQGMAVSHRHAIRAAE